MRRPRPHCPELGALCRFGAYLVILFAGLALADLVLPPAKGTDQVLSRAGFWLAPIGYAMMALEAAVFTIGPAALSRAFVGRAAPGLVLGGLAYVFGLHWSHGINGIAVSTWIVVVLNLVYGFEHHRSFRGAVLQVLGLKAGFWTAALLTL